MPQTQTTVIATVRNEPVGVLQTVGITLGRAAAWASDIAQQFGALLSALMGPAVLCAYAFALWSLASNLGWTSTFIFASGPLSNWLVWLAIAVAVSLAASVLKRHTQTEK